MLLLLLLLMMSRKVSVYSMRGEKLQDFTLGASVEKDGIQQVMRCCVALSLLLESLPVPACRLLLPLCPGLLPSRIHPAPRNAHVQPTRSNIDLFPGPRRRQCQTHPSSIPHMQPT